MFVRRLQVRIQQADREGFDALAAQLVECFP
jgi:hypothetical protein